MQDWKGNRQADYLAKSQQTHSSQLSIIQTTHSQMLHTWQCIINSEAYGMHLAARKEARQCLCNPDPVRPLHPSPPACAGPHDQAHCMVTLPPYAYCSNCGRWKVLDGTKAYRTGAWPGACAILPQVLKAKKFGHLPAFEQPGPLLGHPLGCIRCGSTTSGCLRRPCNEGPTAPLAARTLRLPPPHAAVPHLRPVGNFLRVAPLKVGVHRGRKRTFSAVPKLVGFLQAWLRRS